MRLIVILLICTSFLQIFGAPTADGPIVQVNEGLVQGVSQSTPEGKAYTAFLGIPYAQPPLADLRFKAPVPADPWVGIHDGSIEAESCVQPSFALPLPASGSEDCLTLSVFTTAELPATDLLPVHVFIHGGGYFIGEDEEIHYGPDRFFNAADMVIVFMNYRLGALGFLSTEDAAAPGNFGLLDQNLALQWVQANIAAFGGNPDDVTISGESAGSASVLYHILSPLSAGLFHRAIAESGSALCPWALQEHPLHYAQLIAEHVSCPTDNNVALVDCLRQVDPYVLSDGELAVMLENLTLAFVPVVENPLTGAFLTEDPVTLLTEGRFNKVPMIAGFNRDEGVLIYGFTFILFETIDDRFFDEVIPLALTVLTDYRENLLDVSYAIRDEYYNIDLTDKSAVTRASIDLLSDMFMRSWVVQTINLITAQDVDVYMYSFNYEGDFYWTNFTGGADITHTYELVFLYNNTDDSKPLSARDTAFTTDQFVPLWANFITQGNPSPSGNPAWTPTPAGQTIYLTIQEDWTVSDGNYDEQRMDFWNVQVPAIVFGTGQNKIKYNS